MEYTLENIFSKSNEVNKDYVYKFFNSFKGQAVLFYL